MTNESRSTDSKVKQLERMQRAVHPLEALSDECLKRLCEAIIWELNDRGIPVTTSPTYGTKEVGTHAWRIRQQGKANITSEAINEHQR